jgi:phosphatidylinositol glycan class O
MRLGLLMIATFWTIDAADDGDWVPDYFSKATLKSVRVVIAQVVLALAFAAGYSTYVWASPMIAVRHEAADAPKPTTPALKSTSKPISADPTAPVLTTISAAPAPAAPRPKLIIMGYANTHGTRYLLLPLLFFPALLLLSKPMGQGALTLCMISILNLLEVIDANNLRRSPLGPVVLALLGCFHFFKTGHQAALVTIQWESAFVPLWEITYPWSPLLVVGNTFASFILCTLAVPAVVLWKVPPKFPGLLGRVAGAMGTYILFFAAIALATVVEAAWLRRHLMLYRVFMPRMLVGVVVLLLVEVLGAIVAVGGVRWAMGSVQGVFGWAEY